MFPDDWQVNDDIIIILTKIFSDLSLKIINQNLIFDLLNQNHPGYANAIWIPEIPVVIIPCSQP